MKLSRTDHLVGQAPAGQSQVEQQSLMDHLASLDGAKKIKFLLYRLGCVHKEDSPDLELSIQDYWPELPPLEDLPAERQEQVAQKLAAEVAALEQMGAWAEHGVTMRDKLGLYAMALARMDDLPPAALDAHCTWAQFKAFVAHEVEAICHDK